MFRGVGIEEKQFNNKKNNNNSKAERYSSSLSLSSSHTCFLTIMKLSLLFSSSIIEGLT
jgi:hypothetical protein